MNLISVSYLSKYISVFSFLLLIEIIDSLFVKYFLNKEIIILMSFFCLLNSYINFIIKHTKIHIFKNKICHNDFEII